VARRVALVVAGVRRCGVTAAELAMEHAERVAEVQVDIARSAQPTTPKPGTFEHDIAAALADVKAALGTARSAKRAPLFGITAAELLGKTFTADQWLVTGLITRGGTGVISGIPKAAKKTWLATEIAIAVATGTKVCGEFPAAEGRVAYFYAEDMERQVHNRIRALIAGAERSPEFAIRLHLQTRGEFLDVMSDDDLAWIVASGRKLGVLSLLVLDPLRDIHSAEEDKSDGMRDVMRRLRLLGELLGCTVLAVHHAGKPGEATAKRGGGQRMRGSGAIHGSTDSGIHFLDCDGDGVNEFENTVESEVKGARSAGIFKLGLRIEDDAGGEATRATWTYTREPGAKRPAATTKAAEKASKDAVDDDGAFGFVRDLATRGEHLTRRKLRSHGASPMAEKRLESALNRLIEARRLRLAGANGDEVHLPELLRGDT
jgi:AAA domain